MAKMENDVQFPFLCLLISGGHTLLMWARGLGDYSQLGSTLDNSLGEAIDKASRSLRLPYSENLGPAASLVRMAQAGIFDPEIDLPSLKSSRIINSCDFSFSGLLRAFQEACAALFSQNETPLEQKICNLAKAYLDACADQLASRLTKALNIIGDEEFNGGRPTIVISGGVACNSHIISG